MIERPINRVEPRLPAAAFKTYAIAAPLTTHHRPATCAEIDCPRYLRGWKAQVEKMTPQQFHDATSGRWKYQELRVAEGETWLVYEAGQSCFQATEHRVRLDRPELFIVRSGDHRANPLGQSRQHTRPELWVEDFAEHQQGLADTQQKG